MVATFHTYSTGAAVEHVRRERHRRPAALLQAERAHRRVRGGRAGRLSASTAAATGSCRTASTSPPPGPSAARPQRASCEILFVGRAEGRKGLPVLLRAFEALRGAGVQARLTVAGATGEEVEPLLLETEGVEIAGPRDRRGEVAPARRGRPALRAVARRRELRHGAHGGVRVGHPGRGLRHRRLPRRGARTAGRRARAAWATPSSSARRCATLALDPDATPADGRGRARARGALRLAARGRARCTEVYEQALAVPQPDRRMTRVAQRVGLAPAEPGPRVRPRAPAVARAEGAPPARRRRRARTARRVLVAAGAVAGVGLDGPRARPHSGIESIGRSLLAATPVWVLVAFALMCASMLLRAEAWHAILRAALPGHARAPPRHRARNDDRRADVGDAAGATRRALARADRGAAARPHARSLPGRARHARLPDAAEHPRAGRARAR